MDDYLYVDEEFPDELICKICKRGFRNPCITKCGHTFCAECLEGWIMVKKDDLKCPDCEVPLRRENISSSYKIEAKLEELKVYCIHKEKGCLWNDKRKKLGHHIQTNCRFTPNKMSSPELSKLASPETSRKHKKQTSRNSVLTQDYMHLKKMTSKVKLSPGGGGGSEEKSSPYDKSQMRILLNEIEEMMSSKFNEYKNKIEEQERVIEMYENQKKLAEEEVKIFRESTARHQSKIDELNEEKKKMKENANQEMEKMQNRLSRRSLRIKFDENMELQDKKKTEELEKNITLLKKELENTKKEALLESEEWRNLVEKSRRDIDRETQKLNEVQEKLDNTEKSSQNASEKCEELESDLKKANKLNEDLKLKIKKLEEELHQNSKHTFLEEQIEEKNKENHELNEKINKLQEQLTDSRQKYELVMKTNDTRIIKIETNLYNVIKRLKMEKEQEKIKFTETIKKMRLELLESKKQNLFYEKELEDAKQKVQNHSTSSKVAPQINIIGSSNDEIPKIKKQDSSDYILPIEGEDEIIEDTKGTSGDISNISSLVNSGSLKKALTTKQLESIKEETTKIKKVVKRIIRKEQEKEEKAEKEQQEQQEEEQEIENKEENVSPRLEDISPRLDDISPRLDDKTPIKEPSKTNNNLSNNVQLAKTAPSVKKLSVAFSKNQFVDNNFVKTSFEGLKKVILELKEREKQLGNESVFEKKFPEDFVLSLIEIINVRLSGDPKLSNFVPFSLEPSELPIFYYACSTGIILTKLLASLIPKSLDENTIQYQTGLTMSKVYF